ncbi:MAG: methylated-DNA--[protein]-cysteine S-methyltransferase [Thermoplasmata archaeon]|nr:methylated-DNA--[protein]-cysteine S-methyltransferase [Thermoplasmata archaeon]
MDPLQFSDISTSIGTFRIVYRQQKVVTVDLLERGVDQSALPEGAQKRRGPFPTGSPPRQLVEYFRGERRAFDVEVDPSVGSAFDRSVWNTLLKVPAGTTVTYGELARRSGHAGAARAVGGAMHRNPIPIVIPCHRVVGDEGSLHGFGMGLWRKRWLLSHEGAWPIRSRSFEGPRHRDQRTLDEVVLSSDAPRKTPRTRRAARAQPE